MLILASLCLAPAPLALAAPAAQGTPAFQAGQQAERTTLEPTGPAGGCNPPVPQPGETVVWSLFESPVEICQDTTIPAGATVRIEDPIDVVVHPGVVLNVDGRLLADVAPQQARFTGGGRVLVGGEVALDGALVDLDFEQTSDEARSSFRNATVTDGAYVGSYQRASLTSLEHVVVEQGDLVWFGPLALRDVHFPEVHPFGALLSGYLLADGVTCEGGPIEVIVEHQPRLLSDFDVRNPGNSPALTASGGGANPGSNLLIDADCELQGGSFPLRLRVGGLHPDSVLPASGNQRNAIDIGAGGGSGVFEWPDLGLPYYASEGVTVSGRMRVDGGTQFLFELFAGLLIRGSFFDDTGAFRGRPGNPVRIRQATTGDEHAGVALFTSTGEYIDCEGGRLTGSAGSNIFRECSVRDAGVGITGGATGTVTIQGCEVRDNDIGIEDALTSALAVIANGYERPNKISGNGIGARNNPNGGGAYGPFLAESNWWGHPSGPESSIFNPEGQGDPVLLAVSATPWLTSEPDLSDTPPFVDLHWPFYLAEPGDTILVHWDAFDDGQIVSQRLRMDVSGGGNFQWITIEDAIDPSRRSAFVEIPFIGQTADARSTLLELEVTDDAGNVGRHRVTLQVPVEHRPPGSVQFTTDLSEGLVSGQEVKICYLASGTNSASFDSYLVLDTEDHFLQDGPAGGGTCTYATMRTSKVSTSHARLMIFDDGPGNANEWYFSEPFELRPPAGFPDAPPVVDMLTPLPGERYRGGDTVLVSWTASDDEGLRAFRIQASFNDGRCWSTVDTVEGGQSAYAWQLPPLDHALDQVRVRVVAVDERFQSTAAGGEGVLAFDPGP